MTPPRVRPPRRAVGGFTLVEVLVGALVLGIFISFVYGVVVSAFKVRSVVQSSTAALSTGSMAAELVARDLECALLRPMEGLDAFHAEDEGAGRTRVDFVATTDSRIQEEFHRRLLRSDVTEVGYRTRQGERGLVLYRREQFGVDDRPLEGGDYFKVVDGVKEFRIDWFEKDPSEEGTDAAMDAAPDWDGKAKAKLPRAGRITLVVEGASSDPARAEAVVQYRFTRWVMLPGADDVEPKPAQGPQQGPGPGPGTGGGG